jgi:penicillin-binding protein 1A
LLWGGAALLALLLLLAAAAALVVPGLPELDRLTDYQPKQPLRVYSAEGELMAEFGTERRTYVPLAQIPKRMQDALLAVEDANFYEHQGISVPGMLRAALTNLFSAGRSQGASTITQQLARDLYLTKKKLYTRKFVEILLALKIENQLSKDKILEVYMNQIYLGQRAYGFEAAAQAYFGKPLKQLSIAETAMLAGLPQNPHYANPVINFQRAKRRQAVVLARMQDVGMISQQEAEQAREEALHIRRPQDQRLHAEYAAEMVRQVLHAQYGDEAYTRGIKVYTTLRAEAQIAAYKGLRRTLLDYERRKPWRGPEGFVELPSDAAEQDAAIAQALGEHTDQDDLRAAVVTAVSPTRLLASLQSGEDIEIRGEGLRSVLAALGDKAKPALRVRRGAIIRVLQGAPTKDFPKGAWAVTQAPEAEGALVALEPDSGRVLSLVGGFDFSRNQFNHATQAWRQPGSSFKPLLYSAALELGASPATVVDDAPIQIGDWEPKNSDGQYDGPITLRQALAKSKNMVTIRLLDFLSPARGRAWAARFGLDADKQPDNLTLALGSGSVTPLQMASAYSVFANGGFLLKPLLITRITDAQGQTLFQAAPEDRAEDKRAISERNAFVSASLLHEVTTRGTAARASAALRRYDLYGKTGTTNDAVDAWFAGFQRNVAAVVWIGYDQPRSLGERESGGGVALPAWIDFMATALKGFPIAELSPPAEGLLQQAGPSGPDWVFEEFAAEAGIRRIDALPSGTAAAASAPASGASATSSAP